MAFEQTGQGGLTEGSRGGTSLLSRQRAFQLANQQAFGTPPGGGVGGIGGGGGGAPSTAVPTVTSAQGATGVTPGAVSGLGSGAGMAIDANTALQLAGMGLGFAGNLMGEDQPQQFFNRQGTFAGTGMDPRLLAQIQADLIGGFGDLAGQVSGRPIDLSGSIVQQPTGFQGGPLPFNVGVTGVDPAIANPALVQLPGLDSSQLQEAMDAIRSLGISNISGQDLASRATPEESRLSDVRRQSDSREETGRFPVPRSLGDPGQGMFPGEPIELGQFQKEFIDEERIRRGIQEATQESPIASQVRRRQAQVATPGGLEVLQQAATEPGKGVRRRKA